MAFSQIDEFLLDTVHPWLESPGTRGEEKLVCPKQTKSARQAELTGGTMGDFLCSFGNLKNDQQNESRGKNVSPALNTLTCGRTPQTDTAKKIQTTTTAGASFHNGQWRGFGLI